MRIARELALVFAVTAHASAATVAFLPSLPRLLSPTAPLVGHGWRAGAVVSCARIVWLCCVFVGCRGLGACADWLLAIGCCACPLRPAID